MIIVMMIQKRNLLKMMASVSRTCPMKNYSIKSEDFNSNKIEIIPKRIELL